MRTGKWPLLLPPFTLSGGIEHPALVKRSTSELQPELFCIRLLLHCERTSFPDQSKHFHALLCLCAGASLMAAALQGLHFVLAAFSWFQTIFIAEVTLSICAVSGDANGASHGSAHTALSVVPSQWGWGWQQELGMTARAGGCRVRSCSWVPDGHGQ